MTSVALAREAMATRFEMVLHGEDPVALRAAGEEALDEVERLEAQLSLYCPTSEVARLNARAARGPVRVEPGLFRLLEHACRLWEETGGAFDITVGPLMRCWGFLAGSGAMPSAGQLEEARARVGMQLLQLDPQTFSVRFLREGVMLDLGAIGKGYALEQAAEILREIGITSALLHGGTSTIIAIGHPPDAEVWKVAINQPPLGRASVLASPNLNPEGRAPRVPNSPRNLKFEISNLQSQNPLPPPAPLAVVPLQDESLSVSAVWGKFFQREGRTFGHVIDPRTGEPAANAVLAAVALPSATESDALSTALLTVGLQGHAQIASLRPGIRTLVVEPAGTPREFRSCAQGIALCSAGAA